MLHTLEMRTFHRSTSRPHPSPKTHLVVSLLLLGLELKPVRLRLGRTGLRLALHIHRLRLVALQLARDVGFLGGRGWRGRLERLDLALGVVGLDGGDLVGLELADVQVLDDIRWGGRTLALRGSGGRARARARETGKKARRCADLRPAKRRSNARLMLGEEEYHEP